MFAARRSRQRQTAELPRPKSNNASQQASHPPRSSPRMRLFAPARALLGLCLRGGSFVHQFSLERRLRATGCLHRVRLKVCSLRALFLGVTAKPRLLTETEDPSRDFSASLSARDTRSKRKGSQCVVHYSLRHLLECYMQFVSGTDPAYLNLCHALHNALHSPSMSATPAITLPLDPFSR